MSTRTSVNGRDLHNLFIAGASPEQAVRRARSRSTMRGLHSADEAADEIAKDHHR